MHLSTLLTRSALAQLFFSAAEKIVPKYLGFEYKLNSLDTCTSNKQKSIKYNTDQFSLTSFSLRHF